MLAIGPASWQNDTAVIPCHAVVRKGSEQVASSIDFVAWVRSPRTFSRQAGAIQLSVHYSPEPWLGWLALREDGRPDTNPVSG
jgi:hypothetical protein